MDPESSPSPGDTPPVLVSIACDAAINYAFQQNAIPVVRDVRISNRGNVELRDLRLVVRSEPEFALPWETPVAALPAGAECRLAPLPLTLSPAFLASIRERVAGLLHFDVYRGPDLLAHHAEPVAVLAPTEWSGLTSLPEILAAFVVPNDAAISRLLAGAASVLQALTGRAAINGYQDKSRERVWQQLAAIHQAIGRQQLRYIAPPASYEAAGQKVRFPAEVLEQRFATCLDLALLFAACCEQAGLHPLIFLHEGHAYAGCWLVDRTLPQPATDDQQALRKLVELEELGAFELTPLASEKPETLEHAEALARPQLQSGPAFRFALDITRARSSGIRPLPIAGEITPADLAGPAAGKPADPGLAARTFSPPLPDSDAAAPRPPSRIDLWKSRLLDLSLRNRLLNFRPNKGTLQILAPGLEQVEDELATNLDLKLAARPKVMTREDPRDPGLHAGQHATDALTEHLRHELQQHRLHTTLEESEHHLRLTDLYRSARLAIEENGTNTLFLAAGVLEWRETEHSDRVLRAPLLLIPVELKRRSVIEGFHLRRLDEDTRLNITLLEMLRQHFQKEIPGLDPLPEDANGVDVAAIFRLFREAVRDLPGWEVKSELWLGQFSFAKFLLWKDLADRLDDLARNRVVRHLVEAGGAPFPNPPQDILPSELDDRFHPGEVYCPRSADSSQLAAVMAAAAGHDFVLEGPPGTGKSQTITNIIAHCLAHGKRILFVAEKRAALDVVHRRLKEEGLAPFCLELHSNKAGKADVLAQFQESLNFVAQHSPEHWDHEADNLQRAREDLNEYVRALHDQRPSGLSAYDCIDYLLPRVAAPLVSLPYHDVYKCTLEQVEQCRRAAAQLTRRAQLIGDFDQHPLRGVRATDWSPHWSDRIVGLLETLTTGVPAAQSSARALRAWLQEPDRPSTLPELIALRGVADALTYARGVPPSFLTTPWERMAPTFERWAEVTEERTSLRQALSEYKEQPLLALNLEKLQRRWQQAQSATFVTKAVRKFLVRWQLSRVHKIESWADPARVGKLIGYAIRLREINAVITETNADGANWMGPLWHDGDPKPTTVADLRIWGRDLHACITTLASRDVAAVKRLRERIAPLFAGDVTTFLASDPLGKLIQTYAHDWDKIVQALSTLTTATALERTPIDKAADHLAALHEQAKNISRGWPEIRPWCAWQRVRLEAEQYGLESLCLAVEDGVITPDDAPGCFERSLRSALLKVIITKDDRLRRFFGQEHESRITQFRELDAKLSRLTRDLVRARLAANLPREDGDDIAPKAELGLLRKEISKKARHLPTRQLLGRIPALMPRLKPCLLMSPLSVAQYLDPRHEPFDIVVFDEASQIPVWDAVGAIARGKQLIVVGDPKQLPPTTFFNRSDESADEEVAGEFEDLESILDELLSSGLRHKRLQWHYRSRHEGLIAFSNRHYYANDLLTFPSPNVSYSGVRFHRVDAPYDKGRSRTNPGEAEALVAEIVRRLRDPDLGNRSFGVVTFSQAQQQLVENLLDEQRRLYPDIERHFGDEPPVEGEPVFVKNLENVQGDERDVILFSICYGPDEAGRVSMNFGPLNRNGGERRLNVAITRAKEEVVVFSSLRSDHIDLTRTQAKGVRDLKYFLEYAERGPRALAVPVGAAPPAKESDFEEFLFNRLRAYGFEVQRHVGCSDYRIDLAVVDPKAPDRYVLGIECDGPTYKNAATARDRDKLRQSVLEGLGWKLVRLWSTDWWHDPAGESKKFRQTMGAIKPLPPPR